MERANEFLGHPHVLTDIVRYGYKLGRTLGTPTINMCFPDGVSVPAFGVYATKVFLENKRIGYTGVTNIGIRPTVDDSGDITAETHILNFERNLYGCKVRLEFYKYLRPEIVFDDVDKLKAQILKDCEAVSDYFASI
jgi:riboflavin kinase/FMN adenylyltransferase